MSFRSNEKKISIEFYRDKTIGKLQNIDLTKDMIYVHHIILIVYFFL